MFLSYSNQYASRYGMDLDAFAQTQGYTDADAMLAALADNNESNAKEALVSQAVAEAMLSRALGPVETLGKTLVLGT